MAHRNYGLFAARIYGRRWARTFRFALGVLGCFCLLSGPANTSRADPAKPCRPLIFIPGILGSQLLDKDNHIVWGDASSFKNFSRLTLAPGGEDLHVGDLITVINILGPLWDVHQYDGLLQTLSGLNYVRDKNLFILPYDWRLSNFDTANQLAKLIAETPDLKDQQYDILAHSMGGIVANVYLQQAHDKNAKRLINLGVPLRGSMNALAETSEGWGGIENYMAGGMTTIRRVMFSFPSLFELMPSYDKCCRIGTTASYHEFDPTETDLWKSHDWLPAEYQAGDGYAGLQARMDRARELRELVAKPLPPEIQQIFFAGDMIATKLYLYVDPSKQNWQNWNYSTSVGDGTVPIWSAAGQNGVGPSQPSFSDHATIFDDDHVIDSLKRLLNCNSNDMPLIAATNLHLAVTATSEIVKISTIDVQARQTGVPAGAQVELAITVAAADQVTAGQLSPNVLVTGPDGTVQTSLSETTTPADLETRNLKYSVTFPAATPGTYSSRVSIPGIPGSYTRDVIAFPAP